MRKVAFEPEHEREVEAREIWVRMPVGPLFLSLLDLVVYFHVINQGIESKRTLTTAIESI